MRPKIKMRLPCCLCLLVEPQLGKTVLRNYLKSRGGDGVEKPSCELRWDKHGVVVVDDGEGQGIGDDLGDSGPSLGAESSRNCGVGPTKGHRTQTG